MKIGIVGVGAVGTAALMSIVAREAADEIVLIDRDVGRTIGVARDLQYCAYARRFPRILAGDYADLRDADLVIVAAGINEKAGGATDRADPAGRMRLLGNNAGVIQDVMPRIVEAAPEAIVLIVTNPPEPLAELARHLTGHERVFSAGTMLDTARFRFHVAEYVGVQPGQVDATVVAEHGNSRVLLWSSARVGQTPIATLVGPANYPAFRARVETKVRDANIAIIEKIGASQYGIGNACGRFAEAIANDEETVFMLGSHVSEHGTTLAFPTLVRRDTTRRLTPAMSAAEQAAVEACAAKLREAVRQLPMWRGVPCAPTIPTEAPGLASPGL